MSSITDRQEMRNALLQCRGAFLRAGIFSFFLNLLMLTVSIYTLLIYDRVLRGGGVTALIQISALAVVLLLTMALMDYARARTLIQIGRKIDEQLRTRVFSAVFDQCLQGARGPRVQALRELDGLRGFLSGPGPVAFFDAPWVPLYLFVVFLFHPVLGAVATVGAVVLFCVALLTDRTTRKPLQLATAQAIEAGGYAESSLRNAEVVEALGMLSAIRHRWMQRHSRSMDHQLVASNHNAALTSVSKLLRIGVQLALMGTGALLALWHMISPGILFAASIVMARALAPVESMIGQWRQFVVAREAYRRLHELLQNSPPQQSSAQPAPAGDLVVDDLVAAPPGVNRVVLDKVCFNVAAGEALGVVGPSACGKSTLARHLVGVWHPQSGAVRLGGTNIHEWNGEDLGPHIGYLPQDVELFSGTVAENISRFADQPDQAAIETAARRAGVHEMILRLPKGYDTQIGEQGGVLSGGQRQRVALARAVYGAPVLVVLDEPNSSLDTAGDTALTKAIQALKAQGTTVVVMAHRHSAIEAVDKLLVLREGRVTDFGPKPQVLATIQKPATGAKVAGAR